MFRADLIENRHTYNFKSELISIHDMNCLIDSLSKHTEIHTLSFEGCGFEKGSLLQLIDYLKKNPKLKSLKMAHTPPFQSPPSFVRISPEELGLLFAALESNDNLESLELNGIYLHINREALAQVRSLANIHIKNLALICFFIPFELISTLKENPYIKTLDIYVCFLEEAKMLELAKNKNLESLYAEGATITPKVMTALCDMPNLKNLAMEQINIESAFILRKNKTLEGLFTNNINFGAKSLPRVDDSMSPIDDLDFPPQQALLPHKLIPIIYLLEGKNIFQNVTHIEKEDYMKNYREKLLTGNVVLLDKIEVELFKPNFPEDIKLELNFLVDRILRTRNPQICYQQENKQSDQFKLFSTIQKIEISKPLPVQINSISEKNSP